MSRKHKNRYLRQLFAWIALQQERRARREASYY